MGELVNRHLHSKTQTLLHLALVNCCRGCGAGEGRGTLRGAGGLSRACGPLGTTRGTRRDEPKPIVIPGDSMGTSQGGRKGPHGAVGQHHPLASAPTVTSPRSALPGTPSFNTHAAARVHLRLHPPGNGEEGGPAAAPGVSVQWQEGTAGRWPPGDSLACSGDTGGPLCWGSAGAGLVAELTERSSDLLPTQSFICFISVVNSG